MNTITERVQRGAEWLDVKYPGWHDKIDLSILDMGSCNMCVLGQVYTGVIPASERGQVLAQVLDKMGDVYHDLDADELAVWHMEYQENLNDGTFGGYNIVVDFHELDGGGEQHGFVTMDFAYDEQLTVEQLQAAQDAEYALLLDEWTKTIISRRMARQLVAA